MLPYNYFESVPIDMTGLLCRLNFICVFADPDQSAICFYLYLYMLGDVCPFPDEYVNRLIYVFSICASYLVISQVFVCKISINTEIQYL